MYSTGVDLGFLRSESLNQGFWGHSTPEAIEYFVCEVQKCHLMQILFCEMELPKVVPGGVVGVTLWKV